MKRVSSLQSEFDFVCLRLLICWGYFKRKATYCKLQEEGRRDAGKEVDSLVPAYCAPCMRIGHFRVHLRLHFKARLIAKSLLWKSVFIYIEIGTNYHNKNFALRLALKERLRRTRKWPIHQQGKMQIHVCILWFCLFCYRPEAWCQRKSGRTYEEIASNWVAKSGMLTYFCCFITRQFKKT